MRPNVFIIGAPKCGTTTLHTWLRAHPQAVMSEPKEPHYFNVDSGHRGITSLDEYEGLFGEASKRPGVRVAGEASVWYYLSDVALKEILAYSPDARFVYCIRNPVEAAVSLHAQLVFVGYESLEDFGDAWAAQEGRASGRTAVPRDCADARQLGYGPVFRHAAHLRRIGSIVDRERLHIVTLDDVQDAPAATYRSLLAFLGLDDDGRTEYPVGNPRTRRRGRLPLAAIKLAKRVKHRLGIRGGMGVATVLDRISTAPATREGPTPEQRAWLADYFREDVNELGTFLGRDLSSWMSRADADG